MEATITNEALSTTSESEVATEEVVVDTATPQAESDITDTEAQDTAAAEEGAEETSNAEAEIPWSLGISYNHEDFELTKDEAVRLSQLGKHYEEKIKATFDGLDYLAALRGKTPKEYIEDLIAATDNMYREELIEQLGEDNEHIEELVALRREKNDKTYKDAKREREEKENKARQEAETNTNTRLAEQFENIKAVFPAYGNIADIPANVFKAAVKSGDLEKELLRFHFAEQKKVEKEKQKQVENSKQSTGPVSTSDKEHDNMSAFKRSFWGS
jgi:hypothetical protein